MNTITPSISDNRIFKVGDRVMSKFGETVITNIEVTDKPGEKYGMKRDFATIGLQAQGRVMIDMANKHWAYSEQFEVLDPREPSAEEAVTNFDSIEFWKGEDEVDYSVAVAPHRVNVLSSGKSAFMMTKDEIVRIYNLMNATGAGIPDGDDYAFRG